MKIHQFFSLLLLLVLLPSIGYTQSSCTEPVLSNQQVKSIIDTQRATRTDLPKQFREYKWSVRKQGCHYVYIEYGLPEAFDYEHILVLNQYGIIVDVQSGAEIVKLKCPDKVFTESELTEIIKKYRKKRDDLPPSFPSFKARVSRLRCQYLYYEYALPEIRGKHQVFIIDPFGELIEFLRSQPY